MPSHVGQCELLIRKTSEGEAEGCKHRRNFVCDDGDLSPPHLKVVVTVAATFSKWNLQFNTWNYCRNLVAFKMPKLHVPRRKRMLFSYKNTNFSLYFGQENRIFHTTRSVVWPKICRKCDCGRGFAPNPAGGAHDAPLDPLVGWGADTPLHTPPHSAPRCSRIRRLDRRAP